MNIRKATLNDANIICNIYNYYIENTVATFETKPIRVAFGYMKNLALNKYLT